MSYTLTQLAIFLQIPIVFFLVSINLYARTHLKRVAFKIMSFAWATNLLYLIYTLLLSNLPNSYPNLVIPFLDTISAFLFFCSTLLQAKKDFQWKNNKRTILLLILLFIVIYLIEIAISLLCSRQNFTRYDLSSLPTIIIDVIVLFTVGKYFKRYTSNLVRVKWLTYSFYFYAFIQILAILPNYDLDIPEPMKMDVATIGFSLGLVTKSLILYSFINVLLVLTKDVQKLQHKLEYKIILTIKLNQIIGRTFHEITPVIAQLENQIDRLLANQHEYQVNKRVVGGIQQMENTVYRVRTIIAAATKMYYSDMKDEPSSEKYTYPIPILAKEEVLNVNTIIEIAITNFKAYLSILRNPDIDYSDLERNFMTTSDVKFTTEYAGNCLIFANSADLVQVFYNAFKNSYEALYSTEAKCNLFIKTKIETEESPGPNERIIKYVRIDIEDNGIGIPIEIQQKIFDSGFSTKNDETGRGRGFGMEIIKSTVEEFNGLISVESPIEQPRVLNLKNRPGAKITLKFPKAK